MAIVEVLEEEVNLVTKEELLLTISLQSGYIDVSTVDVASSKLISGHIKATRASFLKAPSLGSKKPAKDGQLIFLTAGDKFLYDSVASLLDIMSKNLY